MNGLKMTKAALEMSHLKSKFVAENAVLKNYSQFVRSSHALPAVWAFWNSHWEQNSAQLLVGKLS